MSRSIWCLVVAYISISLGGCAERVVPLSVEEQKAQAEALGAEPECGDGVCEQGESGFSCVQDCGVPSSLFCYAKACPEAYGACLELGACSDSLGCWLGCSEDENGTQCMADCSEGTSGAARFVLDSFVQCADESGCVSADEQVALGVCGDGVCELWEQGSGCPEDCGAVEEIVDVPGEEGEVEEEEEEEEESIPPDSIEAGIACLAIECAEEISSCEEEEACAGGLECALECENTDTECLQGCLMGGSLSPATIALGLCAMNSGCFDLGETGTAGPICGDGICEDGESDCPEDCDDAEEEEEEEEEESLIPGLPGTGDLIGCLTTECGTEIFECFGDPECQEALFCLIGCGTDFGCLAGCFTGGGFSTGLLGLAGCAVGSSCLGDLGDFAGGAGPDASEEAGCGDGVCDGLEFVTCPEDCE